MNRAILVDDEYVIRTKLSSLVDWKKCGFELVETFAYGEEAIKYLKNNTVDLIITDIRMKNISGIDIAKFVFDNKLDILVIFLSGYDDIEYAKFGMQYNVKRYINKPVSIQSLEEVIVDMKVAIDDKRMQNDVFSCYIYNDFFDGYLFGNKYDIKTPAVDEFSQNYFCLFDIEVENRILDSKLIRCFYNVFLFEFPDINFCLLGQMEDFYTIVIFSEKKITNDWVAIFTSRIETYLKINVNIKNIFYAKGFEDLKKIFKKNNTKKYNQSVIKAKEYIDDHINEELTLKVIANEVFLSPAYLSKAFKRYYNMNIVEYIPQERIKLAKQLLLTTDYPISEIVRKVGYENIPNFYHIFKKHTGLTPAEYRNTFCEKI